MFCKKKKTVLFTSPIILLLPYKNYIIRIYTYELWCYSSIYTIFEKLIDVNLFNNMYFLISVISINPSCGTCVSSLQGILVETIFRFLFWKYWEFQMSQNFWAKNEIDLDRYYIVLSLLKSRSPRSTKTFFKIGGERSCRNLNVSIATFIVTELSLSSKSWKDDDLLLYIILNALSCIRFVLCRSVQPKVFLGKGILKIWNKSTGEHSSRIVISVRLLCNFIEITLRQGCSPVNLLHIFRTEQVSWVDALTFLLLLWNI